MEYDGISTYSIVALIITTIIGPIISWILAKKKYGAEVDSNIIANMRESLEFYKQLSDDNKQRLEDVLKKNAKLEDEVSELRKQVMTLSMMVAGYGLQEKIASESDGETANNVNTEETTRRHGK